MANCEERLDRLECRLEALENRLASLEERQKKLDTGSSEDRSLAQRFASEIDLIGLSDAIKSKNLVVKALWLCVFLCCLGGAVYFVYKLARDYQNEPTATKIGLEKVFDENGDVVYEIPPMILCIDNWLNTKKAMEMGFTMDTLKYALGFFFVPSHQVLRMRDIPIDPELESPEVRKEFETTFRRNNFTKLDEFFKYIALDTKGVFDEPAEDDISVECFICDEYELESGRTSLPKVITDRGVCYEIDLHPVLETASGKLSQIPTRLDVPDVSGDLLRPAEYWRLYINPPVNRFVSETDFVSIRNGYTHFIRISSDHYKLINKTHRPCTNGTNYSVKRCAYECESQYVPKFYGCSVYYYKLPKGAKYCNKYYHVREWNDIYIDFHNETINKNYWKFQNCMKKCIQECDYFEYKVDIDVHKSKELSSNDNGNFSSAKFYIINQAASAGGVMTYEEVSTFTFESWIGNIGGTMGIWIGAGIYSFIKFLAFFIKVCLSCERRRNRKPSRDKEKRSRTLHKSDEEAEPV